LWGRTLPLGKVPESALQEPPVVINDVQIEMIVTVLDVTRQAR